MDAAFAARRPSRQDSSARGYNFAVKPVPRRLFGIACLTRRRTPFRLLTEGDPAAALKSIELSSDEDFRLSGTALAMTALGRSADADTALTDLERRFADVDAYEIASVYEFRGNRVRAFVWLDRAFSAAPRLSAVCPTDPLLNNLRADPRYKALLRRMNLPE